MKFTRFQSLLNENPKNYLSVLVEYKDFPAVMTEKLHGANFSMYISSEGSVRFASRNQFMCRDSNFFNFQRYFTEERVGRIVEAALDIIPENATLRVIGELFGGHDALGIKPVQREIRYDGDIQFLMFHAEFISAEGDIRSLDWDSVIGVSNTTGIDLVPIIATGTLNELYQMEIEEPSVLSSKEDIAEGYCYRLEDNINGEAIILKRRTSKFSEIKGKIDVTNQVPVDLDLGSVGDLITPQRVSNVNSHFGFSEMKNFQTLLNAVVEDIKADALKDLGVDEAAFKILQKSVARKVVPLIKLELTKRGNA